MVVKIATTDRENERAEQRQCVCSNCEEREMEMERKIIAMRVGRASSDGS